MVIVRDAEPISKKEYWDGQYSSCRDDLQLEGFCNRPNQLVSAKILPLLDGSGSVLEVGAGGSLWLPYLAARYPDKRFVGLDYSESGCARLGEIVERKGVRVEVVHADLFDPPGSLLGSMGLVLSFGVAEHFSNLPAVLTALRRFIRSDGVIFTIIPNMAGVLGDLTKRFDPSVYGIHVPHDLMSFRSGHEEAGLEICEAGYLCSSNFGVLSSAAPPAGFKFEIYRFLSRVSKLGWLFEERVCPLPATRYLAPYIYCIARPGTGRPNP